MLSTIFGLFGYIKKERDTVAISKPLNVIESAGTNNDIKSLLQKNDLFIKKTRQRMPYSSHEFDLWILPIIHQIARYFLLLPASKEHHHRDKGGAFEHSLQTGLNALNLLDTQADIYSEIFSGDKATYKDTCPIAIYTLGLVHDIGKPICDYDVYSCDKNGVIIDKTPIWQPTIETLADWVDNNKIKYYKFNYHEQVIKNEHESFIGISISLLNDSLNKFREAELLKKLLTETSLTSSKKLLREMSQIVLASDRGSAKYYMEQYGRLPRDTSITDNFIEALESFAFSPEPQEKNYRSLPFFWSNLGFHIHYPQGLNAIYEILKDRRLYLSVNRNNPAETLAKILYDCSFLIVGGSNNINLPGVHKLFVLDELTENNNSVSPWNQVSVVTLKQPHLIKVLKKSHVFRTSMISPIDNTQPSTSEVEEISMQARGVHNSEKEFYEGLVLESDNKPTKQQSTSPIESCQNEIELIHSIETINVNDQGSINIETNLERNNFVHNVGEQSQYVDPQTLSKISDLDALNVIETEAKQKKIKQRKKKCIEPISKNRNLDQENHPAKDLSNKATPVPEQNEEVLKPRSERKNSTSEVNIVNKTKPKIHLSNDEEDLLVEQIKERLQKLPFYSDEAFKIFVSTIIRLRLTWFNGFDYPS